MNCPNCNSSSVATLDSRPQKHWNTRKRKKLCAECGHKFTTVEIPTEELSNSLALAQKEGRESLKRDVEGSVDNIYSHIINSIEELTT